MIKTKVAFLEGWFFPANQGFLKTFQIALIGWIKADPPKTIYILYILNNAVEAEDAPHPLANFFG